MLFAASSVEHVEKSAFSFVTLVTTTMLLGLHPDLVEEYVVCKELRLSCATRKKFDVLISSRSVVVADVGTDRHRQVFSSDRAVEFAFTDRR